MTALGLGLMVSGFNLTNQSLINVAAPVVVEKSITPEEVLEEKTEKEEIETMTVEEYVRSYFSDIPVMIEIAKCESRFRQNDERGETLRGEINNLDRGVMQINEFYHGEDSEKLGFNILSLEGNTAYARYLFEKYGVKPWESSGGCWRKTVAYSDYEELTLVK